MASDLPRDDTVDAPARKMFLVTPTDGLAIDPLPKALRFDGAGTVVLRAKDSDDPVTLHVVAGERLDTRVIEVMSTGTTPGIIIHAMA